MSFRHLLASSRAFSHRELLLFSHSVMPILFMTPWTSARQTSLSITNSRRLLKFISFNPIQPSHPLPSPSPPASIFPASGSFLMIQLFISGGQSIGASASAPVLSVNIQDCFPLGFTGLISLKLYCL